MSRRSLEALHPIFDIDVCALDSFPRVLGPELGPRTRRNLEPRRKKHFFRPSEASRDLQKASGGPPPGETPPQRTPPERRPTTAVRAASGHGDEGPPRMPREAGPNLHDRGVLAVFGLQRLFLGLGTVCFRLVVRCSSGCYSYDSRGNKKSALESADGLFVLEPSVQRGAMGTRSNWNVRGPWALCSRRGQSGSKRSSFVHKLAYCTTLLSRVLVVFPWQR